MKYLLLIATIWILAGCTTAKVTVHTVPDKAQVYIKPLGEGHLKLVGQTPLYLKNYDIRKDNGSGPIYMEIRKQGFKTDAFYVTEISKVDLNLNRDLVPERDYENQAFVNSMVEAMFEARRLVEAKRYDEALRIIRSLKEKTPMVATLHELEGGVYILKGKYRDALDAFRLAAKYNPESAEVVKIIKNLEETFGYPVEVGATEALGLENKRQPASKSEDPSKEEAESQ